VAQRLLGTCVTFLWPHGLWLLLVLALLAALYVRRTKRSGKVVQVWPGLLQDMRREGVQRHLPVVLLVIAFCVLCAASARPSMSVERPTAQRTIVLAIDTSGSMQADDIAPSRIGAAQAAARELASRLPEGARLGIVEFRDGARVLLAPSRDREAALQAINSLHPQMGTAIGLGILTSLAALFPDERFELKPGQPAEQSPIDRSRAIVLLTDGQNTEGPEPLEVARLAAQHGVRIYTIGIGTPDGAVYRGLITATPVGIDERTLASIAVLTHAEYFYASTAPDLQRIYSELGAKIVLEKSSLEITALFCALGALLLVAGALLSVSRSGRIA
jgi:Ca-activated chloride channel family protein